MPSAEMRTSRHSLPDLGRTGFPGSDVMVRLRLTPRIRTIQGRRHVQRETDYCHGRPFCGIRLVRARRRSLVRRPRLSRSAELQLRPCARPRRGCAHGCSAGGIRPVSVRRRLRIHAAQQRTDGHLSGFGLHIQRCRRDHGRPAAERHRSARRTPLLLRYGQRWQRRRLLHQLQRQRKHQRSDHRDIDPGVGLFERVLQRARIRVHRQRQWLLRPDCDDARGSALLRRPPVYFAAWKEKAT